MNGFSIAGLLFVAIPAVIVGPFTLIRGRKKVHLLWSAFLSAVALWGFGMYKIGTAIGPVKSFFWWRISEIGVIFIPVFLTHFVIVFLRLKRKLLLSVFYAITFALFYFDIFTNYFIDKLYFAFNEFYYILATPLYTFFICIFSSSIFYITFELARAHKKATGVTRYQIKYLIIAFLIGFSGGLTSYPPVYGINIYPVWNATISIGVIVVAYAILRYRFMDIRIVVRKTFIYLTSAALVYGMFYLFVWIYGNYLGGFFTNSSYIVGLFAAPIFVVIFLWFYNSVQKIANKYFFFTLYNYQKTIGNLSERLNYINDLDEIVNLIVDTVKQSLQLDRAGVLLVDQSDGTIHYKIAKVIGFDEHNGISLVKDNFLTRYLEETQKPLIREELTLLAKDSNNQEKKGFLALGENMKHIEASLCLPLINNKKLIGIIVLGSKISGDAYTKEDLELLSTLSYQAGIAIDSAILYKEIQGLNKNLQQKVDEQTKDILKAYEAEKKSKEMIDATRVEDEALLSSIGDGVIAVDKEGKVTFINNVAEQMLGINFTDSIGKPYEAVLLVENEKGEILPKEKNRLFESLTFGKKIIAGSNSSPDSIYYYVRADKSRFPVAVTIAPVILAGKIIGAVDVFRDITIERQIDRSKSEFVSLASHQLRTPLSAIKWYSEMLLEGGKSEKLSLKQKKYLKEVHHGNERMIKLIDVLLNVSRLDAGKVKSVPSEIDVKKTIEDIVNEQRHEIKKKKQKFIFSFPDTALKIFVDPNLIRMVFQNIISNAVKYTPSDGKITCGASVKGKDILFEISDTGIGIPKDQQQRVFEKLFRANNAFPHDPEGNGLGLYVAKTTVEGMGGKIWFKSKEGEGTTFFITLPLSQASAGANVNLPDVAKVL